MSEKVSESFWCKVYIAGDYQSIRNLCRQFCFDFPFCVTTTPISFIYEGGLEEGVEVGIINYAKYPKNKTELFKIAHKLGHQIMIHEGQWSFSILTPEQSYWFSRKDE